MTSKTPENPAAFPQSGYYGHYHPSFVQPKAGMTLRDYFAACALHGDMALGYYNGTSESAQIAAARAYEIADAMLRARDVSGDV